MHFPHSPNLRQSLFIVVGTDPLNDSRTPLPFQMHRSLSTLPSTCSMCMRLLAPPPKHTITHLHVQYVLSKAVP
jgi:hypothetical protein